LLLFGAIFTWVCYLLYISFLVCRLLQPHCGRMVMKNKKLLILLAASIMLLPMMGCSLTKGISTGEFVGTTYSNDFFNLSFKIPDNWTIGTKEQMAGIFKAGEDMIGSADKDVEKTMKLAEQKTLYLAYCARHPLDSADGFNSNINVTCTNLGLAGLAVKSSKDYAEAVVTELKDTFANSVGYTYTFGEIASTQINDAEFSLFDATRASQTMDIKQRMYCTIQNNYAVMFSISWQGDNELEDLMSIVDSICFK
jgi:hypothetical protein